jgi:Papain family cysteine protease
MTDEEIFATGAIPSPVDTRDWTIDMLYAAQGIVPPDVSTLPASYRAPTPYPPTLNQGNTPQCVSFESAHLKTWEGLHDPREGAFVPNTGLFFSQIGGTANGAQPRNALNQMLNAGYPPMSGAALAHKIAAYYAVPRSQADIKTAIAALGPISVVTPWFRSWFHPVSGVLPAPDTIDSYHNLTADGWDPDGLDLWNSWGTGWGINGHVKLPWAYLDRLIEAWKAVDTINPAPPTVKSWRLNVAAHAQVHMAVLGTQSPPKIMRYDVAPWGASASNAPGNKLVTYRGAYSGQALCLYVTKGAFVRRWVRIARVDGTSITPIV